MAGYMLMFNGFCITLLGLLTEWGAISEELAKWHELDTMLTGWFGLHINPADCRRLRPQDFRRRARRHGRRASC